MEKLRPKIIIEDYKNNFDYKKNDTNLNIQFNRVAFIFFFFFMHHSIISILSSITLPSSNISTGTVPFGEIFNMH